MNPNSTHKPSNQGKSIVSQRGFALIATISILSLIALISLALVSLSTNRTKVSSYGKHLNIAKDNARLALEIAIGQLQKYTGPDQRVTARADITDKDWSAPLSPQVANPYYHLAWDVSGSEFDYTGNLSGFNTNRFQGNIGTPYATWGTLRGHFLTTDFTKGLDNNLLHRPGMNPGHDFKGKLPAVLVSGNEFFDLTNKTTGEYLTGAYPTGYITAETSLTGTPRIEIIPSQSIMVPGSLDSSSVSSPFGVEVPVIDIKGSAEGSRYAFWIGDESLKSRINLGSDLTSEAASKVAQRSPIIESFQSTVADSKVSQENIDKRISTASLALNSSSNQGSFSYSPDVTTSAESLVIDVRNGGFKEDFTHALYTPSNAPSIPIALRDNSIPLDLTISPDLGLNTSNWTQGSNWGQRTSALAGLLPVIGHWRNLASDPIDKIEVSHDPKRGLYPLLSQAQLAQHLSFETGLKVTNPDGTETMDGFRVYAGFYPSITLWNPYNIPLKLSGSISKNVNDDFKVEFFRRNLTEISDHSRFTTSYDFQKADGSIVNIPVVWPTMVGRDQNSSGWTLTNRLNTLDNPVEIPPGETVVFSPKSQIIGSVRLNQSARNDFSMQLAKGWNPGQGLMMPIDEKIHSLQDYGGKLPKVRIVQPRSHDNLSWTLTVVGRPGFTFQFHNYWSMNGNSRMRCSQWSKLEAVAQNTSNFFVAPSIKDKRQDVINFPGLLVKHGLRMGDDYLLTPTSALKPGQTSLSFPYVANYNPAAISHAGFGDANGLGITGEAVNLSPTLMGGVFDYQTAGEIYPVATKSAVPHSTPIGNGYLNGSKLIMMNRPFPLPATVANGESASITSFSQLNNSQFLKGIRPYYTVANQHIYGYISSSNIPAFPIGNSVASPKLDLTHDTKSTYETGGYNYILGGIGRIVASPRSAFRVHSAEMDYSYLLNEYLYDHYFFSTIPQNNYDTSKPLVNSRLITSKEAKLDHAGKLKNMHSARYLKLVGGFNVNSTSVPAWEMLLSSSLGTSRTGVSDSDTTVSFANNEAKTPAVAVKVSSEDHALDGNHHMTFTQPEIRKFAEAMVSEVKRRGPFPSLSAFINRANFLKDMARSNPNDFVGTNNIIDARFSGAIQSALDRIEANEALDKSRTIDQSKFTGSPIHLAKGALRKSVNSHLPGYLKQSDVLAQIAPVITVRGDTFTIRCFGASGEDDKGNPIAKAVCEAVVQRGKEFVDTSNTFDTPVKTAIVRKEGTSTTLTTTNQRFGRRYKIVSFKWLPQTEVKKMTLSSL